MCSCLPLSFLKCILIPVALMILVLSGLIAYYLHINDTVSYSLAGYVFFIGMSGLIGGYYELKVCNCIYTCCLSIYTLISLLIFIEVFLWHLIQVQNPNCQTDWKLNILANSAQNQLCSNDCICGIKSNVFSDEYIDEHNLISNDTSHIVSYQECSTYKYTQETIYLHLAESSFPCAGWCELSPIYLFTNVNRGVPEVMCFAATKDYINTNYHEIAYILGYISSFLITVNWFTCCMIFHPRNKAKPAFDRISYKFKKVYHGEHKTESIPFQIQHSRISSI